MPISVTGCLNNIKTKCAPLQGFTLLELLVVMLIIGIIASLAVIGGGDTGEQQQKRQNDRLQALIRLAMQEAVISDRQLALGLAEQEYAFYSWQQDAWQMIEQDAVFRRRKLPAGLQLALEFEQQLLALDEQLHEHTSPQIYFLSSGEVTSAIIDIVDADSGSMLSFSLDMLGNIEQLEVEPPLL